jgi:putative flippase GtrA
MFKKKTISGDLIRYGVVGLVAFCADFAILYLCKAIFGMHYLIAAAFGFCAGLLINYILSIKWVFSYRKIKNPKTELLIFAFIGLMGLLINEMAMYVFTGLLLFHYLYSKVAATVIVFFWNFIVRRATLFKK